MKSVPKRMLDWTLFGLFAVATGCAPASDKQLEALPWNPASVPPVTPASNQSAHADGAAPAGAVELEFRDRLVQKCQADLRRIAGEQLVVESVKKANDSGWQSQQQIDQTDLRWRQTTGTKDSLVQKYLMNPCADLLRREQQRNPDYLELFVMDNKGCIVSESNKTSDYWQGDEPKWIECFNGGNGKLFVGDIEYDQSTRSYVVQISLPIHDGRSATIGAMTVSVSSGSHD